MVDEKRKMTKYDYWVSYVFKRNSGSDLEHGNDHINIVEVYSGIEWIREIEGRISKKYNYKTVKIINFVPLFNEEVKVEPQKIEMDAMDAIEKAREFNEVTSSIHLTQEQKLDYVGSLTETEMRGILQACTTVWMSKTE
ncbi:hypothetical protein [Bacillus thuringiensis]|uniref:hypothetical protein n=1 Tax=Bacillus thuringiensis TaxID=1428 RepID=UPI0026E1D116|nr:hypothetical protein [Bacillus thuringiensis]MDO6632901.1 hypothetical protein [Bacillus thuringiensis]MDO6662194.1 hypothetical protein [Bacillus thuringiensis]MDO6700938.1 hypothetical protein [Bacillus thuringiensis]